MTFKSLWRGFRHFKRLRSCKVENAGNWPIPGKPGWPKDPTVTGFHMMQYYGREYVYLWNSDTQFWDTGLGGATPGVFANRHSLVYVGPAQVRLTPEAEGGVPDAV